MPQYTRRVTDDYPLREWVEFLKRYAIFWIPALWLVSSLGFGLVTPRLTAAQVEARAERGDSLLQRQVDSLRTETRILEAVHTALQVDINAIRAETHALIKFDCLSQFISRREKMLVGFCADTLR